MSENKHQTQKDPANDTGAEADARKGADTNAGAGTGAETSSDTGAAPANDSADPAPGDMPGGDKPAGEDPAARIAALEAELAQLKDNALRAMAEAENVRKRAERQVAEANKYGAVPLARDMLTISDNLRRALDAAPQEAAEGNELVANLRAGVEMTEKELQSALQRHNVTEITPKPGDKFDPNLHQAMVQIPTEAHPPGTIAEVMQAGYLLHDRLLRAAMVGVAKAPPEPQADQGGEQDGGNQEGGADNSA